MKPFSIGKIWIQFWFQQGSPASICIFRILFGALILVSNLLWAPDLLNYFGPNGLVSAETIQEFEKVPRFSLLFLAPHNETAVIALYAVLLLSSVTVMIGFFTRTSLVILFLALVSFHHRNVAILHSGDTLFRICAFILIFSPAGEMFSVDKRSVPLTEQWKIQTSCWTQRLLQLQVAAVYCQTFFAKTAGRTWWDGTAVYYASRLEEFQKLPVPFMFDHLWTCQLLTYAAISIELALWTLIWFRSTRYPVLLAAIIMHLGIDWSMNVPIFEYTMIITFINFVAASDIQKFSNLLLNSRFAVSKKM